MANFNKVLLMGNLTKDPELRYTPQGTAVANLRLAVNRKYRAKDSQEWKDEVCFITAVVWDKQAETCNQYLKKGSPLFVEGRLQSRSWDDASGQKRNVIEVRAERVQFLGTGGGSRGTTDSSYSQSAPAAPAAAASSEDTWLGTESEENVHEG
jgi:single-strand DNA-binding protein